jgi:hypothetical protein
VGLDERRKPSSKSVLVNQMNAFTLGYEKSNQRLWPEIFQESVFNVYRGALNTKVLSFSIHVLNTWSPEF